MNGENQNDNFKSEIDALLPESLVQKPEEHPLHMLDNQADPETKPKIMIQKPIRTYESDVADVLASKKTSVLTMATAENERKQVEENNTKNTTDTNFNKKTLIVIISLIFIIAGLGGGYYLYLKSPLAVTIPVNTTNKIISVITPNTQKIISINNSSENKLIKLISSALLDQKGQNDSISELILTESMGSTTFRVTGPDFINKLKLNIPDTLLRSLTNQWMIGTYNTSEQKLPFIILKTDFFQNAFAGMLKWESTLPDEFSQLFNYKDIANNIDISSSSISSFFNIRGKFVDRTILNRDIREFIDEKGQLLILYSFIDKDTIIIATSEATLKNLIEKIEKQTYIRYN